MKNILTLMLSICIAFSNQAQQLYYCTSQADVNAIPPGGFKNIELNNDTNLPLVQQISDLSPIAAVDTFTLNTNKVNFENLDQFVNNVVYELAISSNLSLNNVDGINESEFLNTLLLQDCPNLEEIDIQLNTNWFNTFIVEDCNALDSIILSLPNVNRPVSINRPLAKTIISNNINLKSVMVLNPYGRMGDFGFEENRSLQSISIPFLNDSLWYDFTAVHNEQLTTINLPESSELFLGTFRFQYNYRFDAPCVFQYHLKNLIDFLDSNNINSDTRIDIVTNGTNTSSLDDILNYDCSTSSIAEVSNAQGTVFPNPSTGVVNVQGLEEPSAFSLMSLQGTEVMQGVVQNQEALDMSHLPKGLYFLRLEHQTPIKVILE